MDDEPALFVSSCLTHPLRGGGFLTEAGDGRQGSKLSDRLLIVDRTWLSYAHQKLLHGRLEGATFCSLFCCASFCLFFPTVLISSSYSVVVVSSARSFNPFRTAVPFWGKLLEL